MPPTANILLHALAAAVVAAIAATAAAEPAYIKLGGAEGENARSSTKDARIKVDGQTMPTAAGKEKWIELQSFSWGTSQSAHPGGGQTAGDPDRPMIAGSVPNASASKRQHGAVTITKEWGASTPQLARPLAKGSVRVRVATPWTACRVGAHYPSLELGEAGGMNYLLQDVTVARCGGTGDADDRPTEEVAFYYNRIALKPAR